MQGDPAARTCIVGAGASGLATARALDVKGLAFDLIEAGSDIGGNWTSGVYDGAHLISSRDTSGFLEFPMPSSYPDFPSRMQVRDYLQTYVDHFQLRKHLRLEEEVTSIRRAGGADGPRWHVASSTGHEAIYDSVVIANGHLREKVVPDVAEISTASSCTPGTIAMSAI